MCNVSLDGLGAISLLDLDNDAILHYRLHGRLGFSYESASTRRFRHGRVDNIRSSHPEALGWVTQMANPAADNEQRLAAFKVAIGKQTQIMVENITGFGMDIPMLGVREATKALRAEPIPLFADGVYTASNLFQISTSQVRLSRSCLTVRDTRTAILN